MSVAENKAVIQNWVAARNSSNLEAALACWTDDNHEWLAGAFHGFTAAFPDIHVTIDEMIAEGDKVAIVFTLTATHRGAWRGIPPTGNAVRWRSADLYTLSEGRIRSLDRNADQLDWLRQLGACLMWQDQIIE